MGDPTVPKAMNGTPQSGDAIRPHQHKPAKYPEYLPCWPDFKCPPLAHFEHDEPALRADPELPDLTTEDVTFTPLTPSMGTVINGLQVSSLTTSQKDQLALLCAERKVLAFAKQDLAKNLSPAEIVQWCSHYGPPTIHPIGPTPKEHPEIHIAHTSPTDFRLGTTWSAHTTSMNWHMDGSVEPYPPGLVVLWMLECPETGGDTVFCDLDMAYEKLSAPMQERLHGLMAEHSDVESVAEHRAKGGYAKRDGISAVYPLIRTHPVTGKKSIYVNPIYTTRILGLKQEESDLLLNFLKNHIALAQDCQVRVPWAEDTVVIFDNRAVAHSAIFDFIDRSQRRHLARVTCAAGKPYETPFVGEADGE